MAKNNRITKSESKTLVDLGDGDNLYFDSVTIDNWWKIYDFLEKKKKESELKEGKNPQFSMSKIAEETKINPNQVRWSLFMASKLRKPNRPKIIKLIGIKYVNKDGAVKISNKVELLEYL